MNWGPFSQLLSNLPHGISISFDLWLKKIYINKSTCAGEKMTVALTKMTAMNKTCFKHPLYFTLLRNKIALYFLASGLPHYKKNFITKRIEKLCRKVKAGKTNAKFYEHDMGQLTQKKRNFKTSVYLPWTFNCTNMIFFVSSRVILFIFMFLFKTIT